MRKIILSVSSLFIGLSAFSQQDFQFTQYMYDRLSFNPGFAGIDGKICATAMFRQQWAGFDGRPQTFLFNVHGPVRQLRGGLGLTFFNDQLGQFKDNYARLSYSFHLGLPTGGTLGIGISGGIISKQLAYNWLPPDGIATITTDNAIPDQAVGQTTYDLSLGLYYAGPNYYVGLSSTHLTESDLSTLGYLNKRHYYVVAGYNWLVPDGSGDWMVKPTLLVKSDASSTQVDITLRGMWRNMVWAGFGYRLQDALPILLGFQKTAGPGMIKIGYSYDITLSDIKDYSSGSHEFMVNYCFNIDKPKPVQKKKTVRFL
jgi:type IX secretion system PorP/SprF family membrane protein